MLNLNLRSNIMDIHTKFVEFLDEHKEKFTDGQYKEMIEHVANDRKKLTRFFRVTVQIPATSGNQLSWEKNTVTVALGNRDFELVEKTHLIPVFQLLGKYSVNICDTPVFDITTNLLPVVKLEEVDSKEEYVYVFDYEQ